MKEINKVVRDYILKDVNQTLARLGISEKVVETKEYQAQGLLHYNFESAPIKQTPMMFENVVVTGSMCVVPESVIEQEHPIVVKDYDEILVQPRFAYRKWDGGMNGCYIGNIYYRVNKDLPDNITEKNVDIYAKRERGLQI